MTAAHQEEAAQADESFFGNIMGAMADAITTGISSSVTTIGGACADPKLKDGKVCEVEEVTVGIDTEMKGEDSPPSRKMPTREMLFDASPQTGEELAPGLNFNGGEAEQKVLEESVNERTVEEKVLGERVQDKMVEERVLEEKERDELGAQGLPQARSTPMLIRAPPPKPRKALSFAEPLASVFEEDDDGSLDMEGSFDRQGTGFAGLFRHSTFAELKDGILSVYDENIEGDRDLLVSAPLGGAYAVERTNKYQWRLVSDDPEVQAFNFTWCSDDAAVANEWCRKLEAACEANFIVKV